jgi:hypothetical protein
MKFKEYARIMKDWRENRISLIEASRALVDIGMSSDQAWRLLEGY